MKLHPVISTIALSIALLVFSATATNSYINLNNSLAATQPSIEELLAQLKSLQAQLVAKQAQVATTYQFTRVLKVGDKGEDVRQLQILLNKDSITQIAQNGDGSPGKETTYFGPATSRAVSKFQEKYKSEILTPNQLTKGTGTVGNATLKKLNALIAVTKTTGTPGNVAVITNNPNVTNTTPTQTNTTGTTTQTNTTPTQTNTISTSSSLLPPTNCGAPVITSVSTASGIVGSAFSYTISITSIAAPTFSASGLPSGLSLSGSKIVGTPTTAGTFTTTITATSNCGTGTKVVTITIAPQQTQTSGTIITPGTGFSGATAQPATIGTGNGSDAVAIARWDTVPYQTFSSTMNVSVVAFHINDIDHVAFSANGGPWTNVYTMTLNPETNVVEYWATLRATDFQDGQIEVRAIVYPKVGIPRVLQGLTIQSTGMYSLVLFSNAGGSLATQQIWVSTSGSDSTGDGTQSKPFASITKAVQSVSSGGTIFLQAGTYDFIQTNPVVQKNNARWITITAASTANKSSVTIRPKGVLLGISRLAISNVTISQTTGNELEGCYYCAPISDKIWIDNSNITSPLGRDSQTGISQPIDWTSWNGSFVTNTNLYDYPGRAFVNVDLVRSVSINKIGDDSFDNPGAVINTTINDIAPVYEGSHIDAVQYFTDHADANSIIYNVKATNVNGQLLFGGSNSPDVGVFSNLAVVNFLGTVGPNAGSSASQQSGNHLLYYQLTLPNQNFIANTAYICSNMSVKNSIYNAFYGSGQCLTITNSHIINYLNEQSDRPVGDFTYGDAGFVSDTDFHLSQNSNLRGRVPRPLLPVDVDGTTRYTPDSLGAFTSPYVPHTPVITLTSFPTAVTSGNSTTLTWSVTDATTCTAGGGWSGSKNAVSGTEVSSKLTLTTSFTLTCSGVGGTATKSITVTIGSIGPTNSYSFDGTVNDSINNVNATLIGNPTYTTGHAGQAIMFNGSNGLNFTTPIQLTVGQTISLWLYPTSAHPADDIVPLVYSTTGSGGLYYWYGSLRYYEQGKGYNSSGTTIPTNQWTHVVAVNNNGSVSFYINGVADTSAPFGVTPSIMSADYVGGTGTNGFVGSIDDLKIYNQALSSDQIMSLYQNGFIARASSKQNIANVWNGFMDALTSVGDTLLNITHLK